MDPVPTWNLWFNRRGRLMGVAIVYRASDFGLELKPNGMSEADRLEWCKELCATLNRRERAWDCQICGGQVDLSSAVAPAVRVGVGRPQSSAGGSRDG